jgi:hypothetical protein
MSARHPAAAAVLLALLAGACAQGPTDFVEGPIGGTAVAAPTRTVAERDALVRDLDSTAARQSSAGRGADAGLPSAMALTILRQQQEEEARALLDAATAAEVPPACAGSADPACEPAPSR